MSTNLLNLTFKSKVFSRPTTALRHQQVLNNLEANGGNLSKAILDAGYSPAVAKTPTKITESKTWRELVDATLSDDKLAAKHEFLLNAQGLDHMTFPLGPRTAREKEKWIESARTKAIAKGMSPDSVDDDVLADEDITRMLAEVNCTVRRIVHGQQARHVYFWSPDNKTQKDTLELAYKIKGKIAPEPERQGGNNTYHIYLQPDTQEQIRQFEEGLKAKMLGHVGEVQKGSRSVPESGGQEDSDR